MKTIVTTIMYISLIVLGLMFTGQSDAKIALISAVGGKQIYILLANDIDRIQNNVAVLNISPDE